MPDRIPEDVGEIEYIYHGSGNGDLIHGSSQADTIFGYDGGDLLYGHGGRDNIFGGSGNDYLIGGEGADQLFGGDGDDSLWGADPWLPPPNDPRFGDGDFLDASNDELFGGDGNDVLYGGRGADLLDGGTGSDRADYRYSPGGVIVDLVTGKGLGGSAHGDTLIGIENLYGSDHGDMLSGDANCNVLRGRGGTDTLFGAGFDDVLWGDEGDDFLVGGTGNDHLHGGSGNDTFIFAFGDGDDAVYDFIAGGTEDQLDLSNAAVHFTSLQDVFNRTHPDGNGNTVIDLGSGDSVILIGVNYLNFTAADFIF